MSSAIDFAAEMGAAEAVDLMEPTGTPDPEPVRYGDPDEGQGYLLDEEDERKVARAVVRLWTSQDVIRRRYMVQSRVNELRRKGYTNVRVVRDPDRGVREYMRRTNPDTNPTLNKAATLCRRTTAVLFADPPAPELQVPTAEDGDVAATELSARVLQDIQGQNQLDTPRKLRRAFDRACSSASAFIHYYVDPKGGGRAPIEVEAVPWAGEIADATRNPITREPWTAQDAMLLGMEWDGETYEKRFVRTDGTLTTDENEAASRWLPELRSDNVAGPNVRFTPHTAEDIWDAEGVLVASFEAWGELKRRYSALGDITVGNREAACRYRPERWEDLTPGTTEDEMEVQQNPDESRCLVVVYYVRECPAYPKGARVVVLGDRILAERGPLGAEVDGRWETHLPPLSQVKQLSEGDDEPMGHGLMEILGPGNELLAAVWGSFLDYLDDLGDRKVFIPTSSIVRPEVLNQPGRRYVPINPGGEPKHEQVPPYPREGFTAMEMIPRWMDNAGGLEQAAQGLEDPSVQSGLHAQTIVTQVQAGLSELKQNVERAYVRCCIIELQQVRAYYSAARMVSWAGEDGEYRIEPWRGADLVSTRDIRIRPGTMTMLTAEQKSTMAIQYASQVPGLIPTHELRGMVFSGVGATVGMQDDPHLLRVRRQASKWREGPPQGWAPPAPPVDEFGRPALDEMGQPLPPPPDPALTVIFDPRAVDVLPEVARVRLTELGKLMASTAYERQRPEWRTGVDMEFARMQQALAPPPTMAPPEGQTP